MSREVLSMIQKMDLNDLDLQMAMQCAPLFAGLKVSNLLIVDTENRSRVLQILKNSQIAHITLSEFEGRVTMLLYRNEELRGYFEDQRVKNLLQFLGYENTSFWQLLMKFRERFQFYQRESQDFPHEMGLFLGYPVEDVAGFIKNEGKKSLCTGYWKVYRNPKEKVTLFEQFEQARERMIQYIYGGGSICQIAL
ncbi:MAG: DUF3793 family protein [Lachnospiraceae bacterium]|nr:DUF3793 family protein [Lachnospiraceae bacterium]